MGREAEIEFWGSLITGRRSCRFSGHLGRSMMILPELYVVEEKARPPRASPIGHCLHECVHAFAALVPYMLADQRSVFFKS